MNSIRKLQIGNVTLENNLILAPMAGVTDLPFRLLCKEQGAGLLCMEMVSAKAILYKNKNTEELLTIDPREKPVSLQLFGSDPDIMSEIANPHRREFSGNCNDFQRPGKSPPHRCQSFRARHSQRSPRQPPHPRNTRPPDNGGLWPYPAPASRKTEARQKSRKSNVLSSG